MNYLGEKRQFVTDRSIYFWLSAVSRQLTNASMNNDQSALNLIAIGIFAMTLSTLLGPLFHLSPFVPAIATFSVLSLATLDTLGWQGQGAAILLELLGRSSPEDRDRVLKHEAGHFLVAYLLEISLTGYALSTWEAFRQGQPGRGGVVFAPVELTQQVSPAVLQQYCTVWMAGIAAETLIYGSAEGGVDDRQQLRNALVQLGRQPSEAMQQERWSILQAKTLIQEHLPAYEALTSAMQQRASVEECCRAIKQHLLPKT